MQTGAANQSLLSNVHSELPIGQRTSGPSYPMSQKGRMRRSFATLRNRAYSHAHDRTPPLRISSIRIEGRESRRQKDEETAEDRTEWTTRYACRSGSGNSDLRNFFFSESGAYAYTYTGCTHTRVSPETHDSLRIHYFAEIWQLVH